MSHRIGIVQIPDYRRHRPIENLQHWAKTRGIDTVILPSTGIRTQDCTGLHCLFVPMCTDIGFLADVPSSIPLVIDYEDPGGNRLANDSELSGRRLALRRAFGQRTPYTPELQVPFLHLPLSPAPVTDRRDIVIFDMHHWYSLEVQWMFLSVMIEIGTHYDRFVRIAGHPIRFYFTSFVSPERYFQTVEAFVSGWKRYPSTKHPHRNPLKSIVENLIPPLESIAEFHGLIPQARLFITNHGDAADQDIVHCGSVGVPIWTIPPHTFGTSRGIHFCFRPAMEILAPGFGAMLDTAEQHRVQTHWGHERIFRTARVPPLDNNLLTQAYYRSWDLLWAWANTGRTIPAFHAAMNDCVEWYP